MIQNPYLISVCSISPSVDHSRDPISILSFWEPIHHTQLPFYRTSDLWDCSLAGHQHKLAIVFPDRVPHTFN